MRPPATKVSPPTANAGPKARRRAARTTQETPYLRSHEAPEAATPLADRPSTAARLGEKSAGRRRLRRSRRPKQLLPSPQQRVPTRRRLDSAPHHRATNSALSRRAGTASSCRACRFDSASSCRACRFDSASSRGACRFDSASSRGFDSASSRGFDSAATRCTGPRSPRRAPARASSAVPITGASSIAALRQQRTALTPPGVPSIRRAAGGEWAQR